MTQLWCCGCSKKVSPDLSRGSVIYPHRPDLSTLPFWRCKDCGNYVGCHPGTDKPLGCIPTKEIRAARKRIHAVLDPLWKSKKMRRGTLYKKLSDLLGYQYHTGEIKSVEEAENVLQKVLAIKELEGKS